jgi:hypothetical protein
VSENVEHLAAFDPLVLGVRPAVGLRRYLLVDVFTQAPLEGNGLGVFTDGRGMPSETMQRLARELNLSETVFILPPEEGGEVRLRIFTPTHELPFAGHPVLGTAFIAAAALEREAVSLETGAGVVHVELSREDDRVAFGRMRQPIPGWMPYDREAELLRALGVDRSGLPVELYSNGPLHVYVELEDESAVAALHPDMTALADIGEVGVSCFAGAGERWKRACSRLRWACRRIPPQGPRQGRWRCISAATGGSPSARRSGSARAPRSGALRSCTRVRMARPSESSASRWAARP